MKITAQDYAKLKVAIELGLTSFGTGFDAYDKVGLTHKRFRWDLFWHACKVNAMHTLLRNGGNLMLYDYLNDDHIDTALNRICKELKLY